MSEIRAFPTTLAEVAAVVACIEKDREGSGERFIPGRYPYTYAWDYARSHGDSFGFDGMWSRAQVSEWAHNAFGDDGAADVAIILAEAYLLENNVGRPH